MKSATVIKAGLDEFCSLTSNKCLKDLALLLILGRFSSKGSLNFFPYLFFGDQGSLITFLYDLYRPGKHFLVGVSLFKFSVDLAVF